MFRGLATPIASASASEPISLSCASRVKKTSAMFEHHVAKGGDEHGAGSLVVALEQRRLRLELPREAELLCQVRCEPVGERACGCLCLVRQGP